RAGAGGPPFPRVLSHGCLYRPSLKVFCSASLTASRPFLSSLASPIPYRSVLNGLPTTFSLPAFCAAYPARTMSSVLTASTLPPSSAATHLEYASNSCSLAPFGTYVSFSRFADVEPLAEQTFLPDSESGPVIELSSARTSRSCPAT